MSSITPSRPAPPIDSAAGDKAANVAPSEAQVGPDMSTNAAVNPANAVGPITGGLRAHAPTQATRSVTSSVTRSACDPPFTIDEKGHKHYKVACLR